MKRTWRLAALAAAVLAASALAGCGKSSAPAGPQVPTGTVNDLIALVKQSFAAGAITPTNMDPTTLVLLYSLEVDSRGGASAFFYRNTTAGQQLDDAGDVSVNPVAGSPLALNRYQLSVAGTIHTIYTTFISRPAGIALPFDGSTWHRFDVTGSSSLAGFADSVKSVSAPTISAPAAGAQVDSLADLTVTWSNAGADSTVYVLALLRSLVDTTSTALSELVRDASGSATIPQERVVLLPSGAARLSLARFRLVAGSHGGRKSAVVCEAVTTRGVTMQ